MNRQNIILSGILTAGVLVLARSWYETDHIMAAEYKLISDKIPRNKKIKIVFLSDLHGKTYGKNNSDLIRLILSGKPDLILCGGDMYTASDGASDRDVTSFLKILSALAPTYFSIGNHEEYLRAETSKYGSRYKHIMQELYSAKIKVLNNKHADLENNISVYGLELPRGYYSRMNKRSPDKSEIDKYLGAPDKSRYNILLAHSPAFSDAYAAWAPDLVLSGHYHGGIVGIPDIRNCGSRRGLISPDLKLFPEGCEGQIHKNDTDLIVSSGCGTHGINFRLFNKPEVVFIELYS